MIPVKNPDISTNRYKELLWFEKNYYEYQKKYFETFKELQKANDKICELEDKIKEINEYIEDRFEYNEETGEYSLTATFDKCSVYDLYKILKGEENE